MHLSSSVLLVAAGLAVASCGDNAQPAISIGGTVGGLAGSGLLLQNTATGEELAIAANGAFAFSTPVAYGAAYEITVVSQPTSPTQACTVARGTGVADDVEGVSDIEITCQTGVFTVGGVVAGLTGSGLVLQNNGTDDLSINADGTFTFLQPLASGSAFAVTIKTQPTGPTQTCSVVGGNGVIGAGPVTTVMVNCTLNQYAVGGIASGLAGTVVLQNNGGDDITLTANGSFAFPTLVDSGELYAVTVATQPATPSQTCSVSMGTGTVTDANITSVRVDCTTNTYSVSGTVTGLAGTGLVLQNNGGDDQLISGDGTFTFATPVASGAAYAVTVLSNPTNPNQVCTVTNGGGTIGGSNVTDVAITCVTSRFTIGGTVTGLAGSGLVLRNNGGDDLPITADGTFAFSTTIESGQAFAVTVASQPAGPTQTCTVSGGSGTVGGGDVTSVTVNCTTNTYTIGGTISGLAGTVVLRNNGGDNLQVTANGTFAFATPIPSGTNYEVTVLTQPSSPSQTCVVTSGTGGVTNADITSVAVTCTTNEYTVGGTVSGLSGSGLVLRNNGGDDLAISGNGTFTFATSVASGNAYAVTVASQPTGPSQTCVVGTGSGIVGGSDVTSVAVVCTTNTYEIGGTVSGLAGTGLVLRNNSGDDLAITANGTFAFATEIASGGSYAVTVQAQPTSPWQTCVVSNGSGSVTNADITSITITCTTNVYSIGGTVTGLAGTGLVLQQDGGDDLPITGDGTFTFVTKIASGTAFEVTVAAQPSGPTQTCTVSGGDGTVGGADVTSVTINCTTNRYTIGGTVTGLAGGGLVLQQDGGDDLPITANGTFAFSTTVASGDSYAVTVLAQPTSPWQTCSVASGTGTVGSGDVTSVSITCTTNTYSIGGTVTGLAPGNSLVLRNNGANDLTITADGSFTFTTAIASGTSYSVTIVGDPAGPIAQTCSVTAGGGTVAGAAVTDVTITCSTRTFTVGGTVSGMVGTGLVLRNNGGDDLAVNANGSFTFATPVASGDTYSVTVATHPSGGPAEVCSITNGSGTIGGANVTAVVVTCTPPIFNFTTAGATGRFGPTQAQLDTAYTGTSLAGIVTGNAGIQQWVVPTSGTYRIEAVGAAGGNGVDNGAGRGASMRGDFVLNAGDTLLILVGQRGMNGGGAGGGGGTFVVRSPSSPLVIAGGGGGGGNVSTSDASITTNGKTGDGVNPGTGGTGGNGGNGSSVLGPGGGGGFFTNGTPGVYNGQPGFAFLNGGNGGHDQNFGDTVAGGFGGGGGAGAGGHSAGAGGYSGGGASGNGGSGASGGGGSLNTGTNQVNTVGANTGPGRVTITGL